MVVPFTPENSTPTFLLSYNYPDIYLSHSLGLLFPSYIGVGIRVLPLTSENRTLKSVPLPRNGGNATL